MKKFNPRSKISGNKRCHVIHAGHNKNNSWIIIMKYIFAPILSIAILSLTACGSGGSDNADDGTTAIETFPYSGQRSKPTFSPDAFDSLVASNKRIAFDQYHAYASADRNFVSASFEQQQLFAMLALGAEGDTLEGISKAANIDLSDSQQQQIVSSLEQTIGGSNSVVIDSSLWGQERYKFSKNYLQDQARLYGPTMYGVDYLDSTTDAVYSFEDWFDSYVALYSATDKTRLIVARRANISYEWSAAISSVTSISGRFFSMSVGAPVQLDMIRIEGMMDEVITPTYRAVDIPLNDPELGLLIVIPAADNFEQISSGLDEAFVDGVLQQLVMTPVNIAFPVFDVVREIGTLDMPYLGVALSENFADFSRVNQHGYLYLKAMVQKAEFQLTNEQFEAQSAIFAVHDATQDEPPFLFVPSPPGGGAGFVVRTPSTTRPCFYPPDQLPFIFITYHRSSGAVLNLGHVVALPGGYVAPDWTVGLIEACGDAPPT